MGKTAVVAALILSNPATVKPISDEAFAKLMTEDGTPQKFGVTVVIVNNTLVQQARARARRAEARGECERS